MDFIYNLVGKVFYSRKQSWERRRDARTMTLVVVFSVGLALGAAKMMKIYYQQRH